MTGNFCGACGANIRQPGQASMHPVLDRYFVLCGATGKRVTTHESPIDTAASQTEDPLTAARREFLAVMEALAHHARSEDAPCEVSTEGGWMDMADLLEPLGKALGDA